MIGGKTSAVSRPRGDDCGTESSETDGKHHVKVGAFLKDEGLPKSDGISRRTPRSKRSSLGWQKLHLRDQLRRPRKVRRIALIRSARSSGGSWSYSPERRRRRRGVSRRSKQATRRNAPVGGVFDAERVCRSTPRHSGGWNAPTTSTPPNRPLGCVAASARARWLGSRRARTVGIRFLRGLSRCRIAPLPENRHQCRGERQCAGSYWLSERAVKRAATVTEAVRLGAVQMASRFQGSLTKHPKQLITRSLCSARISDERVEKRPQLLL